MANSAASLTDKLSPFIIFNEFLRVTISALASRKNIITSFVDIED